MVKERAKTKASLTSQLRTAPVCENHGFQPHSNDSPVMNQLSAALRTTSPNNILRTSRPPNLILNSAEGPVIESSMDVLDVWAFCLSSCPARLRNVLSPMLSLFGCIGIADARRRLR